MKNSQHLGFGMKELTEAYERGQFGWYPFQKSSSILVVADRDGLPDYVFPAGCEVCLVKPEELNRLKSLQTKIKSRFEYVYLMDVLERSGDPLNLLIIAKGLLSARGTLLIACENRLGLKYICGEKDPCTGGFFESLDHFYDDRKKGKCFSKAELISLLNESGLNKHKFYSAFPGIRYPELIIAEQYQSNENSAGRYIPLYESPDTVIAREEELYTAIAENGDIHNFANAFFVECSPKGNPVEILQVTISANRGKDHASITTIFADHVEKKTLFPGGKGIKELADNLDYLKKRGLPVVEGQIDGENYTMPFLSGTTGDVWLRGLLIQDQMHFVSEMDRFRQMILDSTEWKEEAPKLHFKVSQKGFCDLVPLNTIYSGGKFVIIDQEYTENQCPLDFIVFRMINTVYADRQDLEELLPKDFFYKRYGMQDRLESLIQRDAEFNNRIKNRDSLSEFNDQHMRNDEIVRFNRGQLNNASIYFEYTESCFEGIGDKKIYVCGSDEVAEGFLEKYGSKLNIFKVIDDERTKWGKEIGGYPVSPIDAMVGDLEAYKVIICSKKYKTLLKQMLRMQVLYIGIFDPDREYDLRDAKEKETNGKPYRIGYCAGVYDLFHIGHINIFKKAKQYCDYLIVGVVSDEAVRANKHCEPFIPFEERIEMVRTCKYVDEAVKIPLEAATVWDAYEQYHFDVQFSGSDYEHDPGWLSARDYLREHGSEMIFFPYTESTSSTKIKGLIEKGLLE